MLGRLQLKLSVLGILLLSSSGACSQQILSGYFGSNPPWTTTYVKEYVGCVSYAALQDGSNLRVGFDGVLKSFFLNLSNKGWTHLVSGSNIRLEFRFDNRIIFSDIFHVVRRQEIPTLEITGINAVLLENIAGSNYMSFYDGGHQLGVLSLQNSRRAMNSLFECIAYHRTRS